MLVVAAGAAWESRGAAAADRRARHRGAQALRRRGRPAGGGQRPARPTRRWSALDAPGLDLAAADHLRRHRVRPVAVAAGRRRPRRGAAAGRPDRRRPSWPRTTWTTCPAPSARPTRSRRPASRPPPERRVAGRDGRRRAGPRAGWSRCGAPPARPAGPRSRPALAAELARRGLRTTLVDADPYGGAVAQQLGDPGRGVRAAGRRPAGRLRGARGALRRRPARAWATTSTVVTGLPRPDRWVEVRAGRGRARSSRSRAAAATSSSTPASASRTTRPRSSAPGPGRNQLTLGALEVADEVVVVGTADPVGLSRLARGLVELRDRTRGAPVRVVVNRMRPDPRLVRAGRRRHGRGLRPAGRAALPARRPRRPSTGRWSPAGPCPRRATPRSAGRSAASSTRWSAPRCRDAGAPAVGGQPSGGEQQVEAADGEGDHRHQQRELAGELVRCGRIWIARSCAAMTPTHVAEHDGEHLDARQQRRVVGEPVVDVQSPVPSRLLPLLSGSLAWISVCCADLDEVGQVVRRRCSRR